MSGARLARGAGVLAWLLAVACSGARDDPDTFRPVALDLQGPARVGDVSEAQPSLVLNEVAAAGEPADWFELYNPGPSDLPLDGYTYTDDLDAPQKATFGVGSVVTSGGYLVVETQGFGLGADELLAVYGPSGELVDVADWGDGESPKGGSYARVPDGSGAFAAVSEPTRGAPNPAQPDG